MKDILVSVVIPFFNGVGDLVRAIRSVQAQTHTQLDLILINDGSTEDLGKIDELMGSDPRIRLFSQARKGAGAARNLGIAMSGGEYVAFLDADDVFLPEKIEVQLNKMRAARSRFSHTSYRAQVLGSTKTFEVRSGKFAGYVYPQIIRWCPIATPTVMFESDFLKKFEFPEGLVPGEDVVFWINCAMEEPLLGIDEIYSVISVSPNSAAYNPRKQVSGLCNIAVKVYSDDKHYENRKLVLQLLENAKLIINRS